MENFDALPCAYVSFRDNGTITACNITLASWLGYSKDEISGKSIENIFTIATRIFYNTHFFPLIKLHAKANEIFLSLRGKDGREIPVLANAERTIEPSENVIHCVFIRVEERKKYEQELLQAKREAENALKENKHLAELSKKLEQHALDLDNQYRYQKAMNENLVQFSKIVSHDLQEPIRKIQIFVDLILKDTDTILSAKGERLFSKIDVAAAKLKTLTTSLQEYITIDDEKAYSVVDLNNIIETAKLRATNARQFSDLDTDIDIMPKIEAYHRQLELLFFHLIDNAIQFRSPARRLEIKVNHLILEENRFQISKDQYKYTEYVRITFEDNGIGFSDQYYDYVFQLFNKLENSSTGLGTGLSLVKKIVQNHAGNIRVSSQVGRGTRFEIQLPVKVKD